MSFPAEIVIKRNATGFVAGFASKTKGKKVRSFGRWYGSQMNYKPFQRAWTEAQSMAEKLNMDNKAE